MARLAENLHAFITASARAEVKNLQGRHFIVTGCAIGSLGFATALQLLSQGAIVTVTVRNNNSAILAALQAQLSAELQGNIYAFDLDLSQRLSVEAFVQAYRELGLAVDVLINNAGIHLDLLSKWSEAKLSADGFEMQWRVNYLGTVHLTRLLLPLLSAAGAQHGDARVVNVVSQLHTKGLNSEFFNPRRPYNSWHAYGQSKLALLHFSQSLAERYTAQGISSYCLHPGAVATNIADTGLAEAKFINLLRRMLAPLEKLFLKTAKEGAQTQIHCATAAKTLLHNGGYYRNLKLQPCSEEANDYSVSERLWQQQELWLAS